MTIYRQIADNKLRSYLILGLFVFVVSGFFYIIGLYFDTSPAAYFTLGLLVSSVSALGSYFYSDKIVLSTTRARPATKQEFFDFYTVTENLSIAAGQPMPKLYVIDDPAPNAFATGRDPKHAVVCATTGLLNRLDRAEIEGVIAHELSHIKNYDILVSTLVVVLVGTIAMVSDWIMRSLWWRDRDDRNRSPIMFIFLILALILTPIAATLIQLAISRKREYLADASGALLTRYPEGLARALEKIAADPKSLDSASPSTAHLFISNPIKQGGRATSFFTRLLSTHPPTADRVRILRSM